MLPRTFFNPMTIVCSQNLKTCHGFQKCSAASNILKLVTSYVCKTAMDRVSESWTSAKQNVTTEVYHKARGEQLVQIKTAFGLLDNWFVCV